MRYLEDGVWTAIKIDVINSIELYKFNSGTNAGHDNAT